MAASIALRRLLFASTAGFHNAVAPAGAAAQAAAAAAEMVETRVDRAGLSTAGCQDVQPTGASALRELERYLEADSAGRCRLVLNYFYKRPQMGMAVRTLLKGHEKSQRVSERAARNYRRRRDAQAAAAAAAAPAEILDDLDEEDLHELQVAGAAAAMLVDAGPLQLAIGDQAPSLALAAGEKVSQLLREICDGDMLEDEGTTAAGTPSPPSPTSTVASPSFSSSSSSAAASVGSDLSSAGSADGCIVS